MIRTEYWISFWIAMRKGANSVVQCVGPGFAHLLNGDAFRIVVLAELVFAIRL